MVAEDEESPRAGYRVEIKMEKPLGDKLVIEISPGKGPYVGNFSGPHGYFTTPSKTGFYKYDVKSRFAYTECKRRRNQYKKMLQSTLDLTS